MGRKREGRGEKQRGRGMTDECGKRKEEPPLEVGKRGAGEECEENEESGEESGAWKTFCKRREKTKDNARKRQKVSI